MSASAPASVTAAQHALEWDVASRAFGNGRETGDAFVVVPRRGGVLLAVIDGLGHGHEAATAGRAAATAVAGAAAHSLTEVLSSADEALRHTRGAAMALIAIDTNADALAWMSVGNVEAVLWTDDDGAAAGGRARIRQRPGVVGFRVPPVTPGRARVAPGDLLVVATDGLEAEALRARPTGPPSAIATDLLDRFAKRADDALVLVARYRGGAR